MTYRYTFTVFTPTYNRAHTLGQVFESLNSQTFRDFEWLIVDDGSTDNTELLIRQWQMMSDFPIRYIRQEHAGKHIAFNRAVREAKGELLLNLDSDDACVSEALERFKYHWDSIPESKRAQFSAVTALCKTSNGAIIGDRFPYDPTDSDSSEIRFRYRIGGEKWGFQRTDVLKDFPFPEVQGGSYIPEGIVWTAIAKRYKTRYVNEPLRIYRVAPVSGPSDQLMSRQNPKSHAVGGIMEHKNILNYEMRYFRYAPDQFLRSAVHYGRFSFHCGIGLREQVKQLGPFVSRLLWLLALPAAYIVYKKDLKLTSYSDGSST